MSQTNSCGSSVGTYFQKRNKPSKFRSDSLSVLQPPHLSKSKPWANTDLKRNEIAFLFMVISAKTLCKEHGYGRLVIVAFSALDLLWRTWNIIYENITQVEIKVGGGVQVGWLQG